MARGLNRAEIIGHVGSDVEARSTTNGTVVVNLRIATDESYNDKSGNKVEQTEWHSVVFFGKLAEIVEKYVNKGDKLFVSGSLRTRKWQDKDGNDRYTTEIRASDMLMLTPKGSNGSSGGSRKTAAVQEDDDWASDEDLDF